ncbi:trigger factor [Candidatus Methylospira mobilis]|uniref:trigger factor n=1 Tax=Candidatus Methylospira mobilis TaxID=1808979 RepID=UPI0028EDCF69|nr:trigger factor [Candidatus Methylospira mobilis]WNV04086.1 trigger factor [Candidatus Methylospira mobilis]
MQVSVEAVSELGRKLTVQVPENQIREQVAKRLKSLSRQAKIDGFRPGKVPESVIRQRYGASVRFEVLEDVIQSSFREAVLREKLKPAAAPEIEPENLQEDSDLRYIASFEVMPEVAVTALESLTLPHYVSEVTESDVDAMVLKLREQRKTWNEVERQAQNGDQLLISMEGRAGEQDLTGGKVENMPLELGSGRFIPGFEDHLLGASAGETRSFDLAFPEDYGKADLAGKNASFTVEVIKVSAPVLAELDADFFTAFGAENDINVFRGMVKDNLEREMHRALRKKTKDAMMSALSESHSHIPLPQALVEQEIEAMLTPNDNASQRNNKRKEAVSPELKEQVEPFARKRVLLGFVINQVVENEKLKVDAGRVRTSVEDAASSYESPEQVVNWYYNNPDQLRHIEEMVLEDQVVDLILSKATVKEESVDFQTLVEPARQMA